VLDNGRSFLLNQCMQACRDIFWFMATSCTRGQHWWRGILDYLEADIHILWC